LVLLPGFKVKHELYNKLELAMTYSLVESNLSGYVLSKTVHTSGGRAPRVAKPLGLCSGGVHCFT